MERMKIKVSKTTEDHLTAERNVRLLCEDARVQRFLAKNHLDEQFVRRNYADLHKWLTQLFNCDRCAGLDFCTQPFKGRILNIHVDADGFLDEQYEPCRYQTEHDRLMKPRRQFLYADFSEEDYAIDLQKIDFNFVGRNEAYVRAYSRIIDSFEDPKGIYLYGQPGVGKSYLMKGAANYYTKSGKTVAFVNLPKLIPASRAYEFGRIHETIRLMNRADILFLDDIGGEHITSWTRDEVLFPLLEERMNNRRKTYMTSNYDLNSLQNEYMAGAGQNPKIATDRLMERIRTLCDVAELKGKSLR